MEIFQKAAKQGLRFNFQGKFATVEQLYQLTPEVLDPLAQELQKTLQSAKTTSFIPGNVAKDPDLELNLVRFEIVKTIILDKCKDRDLLAENRQSEGVRTAKRQLLLETIAKKEQKSLEEKSISELKAELENL